MMQGQTKINTVL